MNDGDLLTDSFTVTSADGTANESVTITINGLNDTASISGENAGAMTEDDTSVGDLLAVSDVDNGQDVFQPQTGTSGSYGTFTSTQRGTGATPARADLQSMNAGDILTDSFTVVSADGTASENVTITINGLNDDASISGDNAGAMTEDDTGEGDVLAVSDVDDGEDVFQTQTRHGGYLRHLRHRCGRQLELHRTADLQSMNAGDVLTTASRSSRPTARPANW